MSEDQKLIALLIDADNAPVTLIPQILDEVRKHGKPTIRKIYGDWSQEQLQRWKPVATKHNLEIAHHYHVSSGKNATDIALVIDAMDILNQQGDKLSGFCIVSSDSDFTHLARRIRKDGLFVLGVGNNSSETYTDAYDEFIHTEKLQPRKEAASDTKEAQQSVEDLPDAKFLKLLGKAYKQVVANGAKDEQAKVTLLEVRELMKELLPDFAHIFKGMPSFVNRVRALAEAHPDRIVLEEQPDSKPTVHYLYFKPAKSKATNSEVDKFREAYNQAAKDPKLRDKDGWVTLSVIRNALKNLDSDYDPLMYNNTKYKQLKKVVEQMMADYPNVIELNVVSQHPQIRMKT